MAAYAVLALAYALLTPPWQTPDEPAHYNYAREIATSARLPVLQPGDYDQDLLERLKASRFAGDPDMSRIRYEAWQPPLYYAMGAVLLSLVPAAPSAGVLALRLMSVVLGGLVLVVVFAIGREIFPQHALIALTATGFVAFIPQHLAMSAAANNDVLAELVLGLVMLMAVRRLHGRADGHYVVTAGVLLGLAYLTKVSTYIGVIILAAAEAGRWTLTGKYRLRHHVVAMVWVLGVSLLVGGWWFVRNALTYGNLDVLVFQRHAAVVLGQPRTQVSMEAVRHFLTMSFKSFWAVFGWMGVLVDARIYGLLALLSGVALVGLVLFVLDGVGGLSGRQRVALGLLATELALVAGMFLVYNLTYIQAQGRYLFPASAALGLFLALGLREMVGRPRLLAALLAMGCALLAAVGGKFYLAVGAAAVTGIGGARVAARRVYRELLLGALISGLALLDVICLFGYIMPSLT